MGRTLLQTYQILADPDLHDNPPTGASTEHKVDVQNQPQPPFDSSIGLTILVLLTALFFMGFFSIYIRRFAVESPVELSRRRRRLSGSGLNTTVPNLSTTTRLCTRKGLDYESIQKLPVMRYSLELGLVADCCAVCLAEFEDGESVKMLPFCQHLFHSECIDTWLVARASCPVCRTSKIFKEEERVVSVVGDELTEASGGVRRCCSCSEIEVVVVVGSEERRGGLQRTRSF